MCFVCCVSVRADRNSTLSADAQTSTSVPLGSLYAGLPVGASYLPDIINTELQACAWSELLANPETFSPSQVLVDGSWHETPRLVASFADVPVHMDGMQCSLPWPKSISRVRELVIEAAGKEFNYGLANFYRDGADFAGWHADKAAMHDPGSVIAIVSLGTVRTLEFRETNVRELDPVSFDLAPGSVLLMDLPLQAKYEHRIPPKTGPTPPRISITLRSIPMAAVRE